MPAYGPLVMSPRLDSKPWGGRALSQYGFDLPPGEPIGEALITANEAIVQNGDFAGKQLGDLIAADHLGVVGARGAKATHGLPLFPLLIKLIDANDDLSIQVHPTDETAPKGSLGKTEAWHVLAAKDGALLYLGLADGVDARQIEETARKGESTAHLMRTVPATPGMTVFLPAGTVHALGAGVTIYEIQQPSAITYRLDDWGRVDANGRSRDLHLDESMAVMDESARPEPLAPLALPIDGGSRVRLVACPMFSAERIILSDGDSAELDGAGAPQAFTCLAGHLTVTADGLSVEIGAGQTAVIVASSGPAQLSAEDETALLRGWIDPEV